MPNSPMISPGVRVNVVDQSTYTSLPSIPTNTVALIGAAQFGPINVPTLITSVNQFESVFGTPIDIAGLTAIRCLQNGGTIYYCRFYKLGVSGKVAFTGNSGAAAVSSYKINDITANYDGTILNGGVDIKWWLKLEKVSDTSFNLSIITTTASATSITDDSANVFEMAELSVLKDDSNYYGNWKSDYFTLTLSADGPIETVPAAAVTVEATSIGDNGVDSTLANNNAAVNAAIEKFADPESYSFMYLSAPEYSQQSTVATKMVSIAADRKSGIFQIDHSYIAGTDSSVIADSIINELKTYTGINNNHIALWAANGGYIVNPYQNNAEILVPPSAYIIPAIAALYVSSPVWTAPASTAYLPLTLLTRLDTVWTQSDRDKLYAANINPVLNYKGLGLTAMGQKSGQTKKSALDRLNVVQLVDYVKREIETISVDFLFAPIDEETFSSWIYRVTQFLASIKNNRGLYDFSVKMDWETVTPVALNNNLMPGIVKIKPTKVAEFIDVDLVIKNYADDLN